MKKVLIGTTNFSKIQYFQTLLKDYEVDFITLNDLQIHSNPQEDGKTPQENAKIKALYYGQFFDRVICNDSGLYFANLKINDPLQPGLHIRSPQGVYLDDEAMIAYYSRLVASFHQDIKAYYQDSFAVFNKGKIKVYTIPKKIALNRFFYLTKNPHPLRHPGWPLDSLSLNQNKKYFVEEKNDMLMNETKISIDLEYQMNLIHFFVQSLQLKPKKILETERLYLRKLQKKDIPRLKSILQDPEVMVAYEHAFSDQEVLDWLYKNLLRYQQDGFGLWAVCLKQTNQMIGQCGLTYQNYKNQKVVEIGYLFLKQFWHQGFATEAAIACKNYAFQTLKLQKVYSIIRDNNFASMRVAIRNGMKKIDQIVKHYYNLDLVHDVYCIHNFKQKRNEENNNGI